jgi:hypothetical protein
MLWGLYYKPLQIHNLREIDRFRSKLVCSGSSTSLHKAYYRVRTLQIHNIFEYSPWTNKKMYLSLESLSTWAKYLWLSQAYPMLHLDRRLPYHKHSSLFVLSFSEGKSFIILSPKRKSCTCLSCPGAITIKHFTTILRPGHCQVIRLTLVDREMPEPTRVEHTHKYQTRPKYHAVASIQLK